MWSFAFFCLSLSVTGMDAAFTVTVSGPLKAKENEGIDLKCSYTADFGATPRIEWKFRDSKGFHVFIYFDSKITAEYEQRITVYNGGLRFRKVTRADTGDYYCEVSGNGGYGENTIKLEVSVPPSKPVSKIPSLIAVGSNSLLTCFDSEGSPPSIYKWYKDNTPLPEDPTTLPSFKNITYKMNVFNGNLEFPSVSKLDSGSYFCEASNDEGEPQRDDGEDSHNPDLKDSLSTDAQNVMGKISNTQIMEKQYINMLTAVFLCLSLSVSGLHAAFTVTVSPAVKVKENEEWKFKDLKGSQTLIYYDNKPTAQYTGRLTRYDGGLRFSKVTRADTGDYDCEVSGNGGYGENTIKLTVLVPPSKPVSRIPQSVTTGSNVRLTCFDVDGSPPSTYRWYKDNTPLPEDPTKFPSFKNLTYKMNVFNGNLEFPSVSKLDTAKYFCEASNGEGTPQRSDTVLMEVRDLNVGGIVAGVIVGLLAVALLLFGLWYANKKGYLPKVPEKKQKQQAVYTQSRSDDVDADEEFRQKSSFVV
ncbi:hypothetical protein DNTS_012851 [Danionella cerebrum]|uniref:Junctional adhesion molecule A n=1 Tax=Danionella cerebrum TaxID=2873325 RepID=A0A553QT56_9TELE|nr:hypothetical protein DNTS_012851 [Danionella translucida]